MSNGRPERCDDCDGWERCADRRAGIPASAGCFEPRRRLDLDRLRRFFVKLRQTAGLPAVPFVTMERTLLAHFSGAMRHYSSILEFSFSTRGTTVSPYRFSYSFPAFGEGHVRRELVACRTLVQPFGRSALRVAERVLDLVPPAVVTQPLFGIDARPGAVRLKLYLQFLEGKAEQKLWLLARLLPARALRQLADAPDRLHLLGIDFAPSGVTGYKLYYLRSAVPVASLQRAFPRAAMLRSLAERGRLASLDDVVLISRLDPAGDLEGPPIAELDLGLRANGLGWVDAARFCARRTVGRSFDAFRRTVLSRHRWAATRLSIPAAGSTKLNVYYVLLDPPAREDGP